MSTIWHAMSVAQVFTELQINPATGLSATEAKMRLERYGLNQFTAASQTTIWQLLLRQFKNRMTIILLIATALSIFLGHTLEAIAIGIILLFAVGLSLVQEWRAEEAMEMLRKLAAPTARVRRDGQEQEIPASELVPGDLLLLVTGDRVPADARLIESVNLKLEEAALTGESVATEKKSTEVYGGQTAIADRLNLVFMGTSVVYGRGAAVVIGTGMETEFGRIARLLDKVDTEQTPLEKNLDRLAKSLTWAGLWVVVSIVGLGLVRGQPFLEMILFGVALGVAVVPEALPAVVTISLAIGVQRMVKRHVLVRQLPAVETLGSTTFICSDKTGTLTKDEMTVRKMLLGTSEVLAVTGNGYEPKGTFTMNGMTYPTNDTLRFICQAAVLCSDAQLIEKEGRWDMEGDPTEGALVVVAEKVGLQKRTLDDQWPRVEEVPFSSETKRMMTVHASADGSVVYAKGAAEVILETCAFYQSAGKPVPLTDALRQDILATIHQFGTEALRVIGVAYAPGEHTTEVEGKMIFLGVFGMIDPPRMEVKAAIEQCRQSGIQLMMITGDHPVTAEAIARELGMLLPNGKVVTGVELTAMSDDELEKIVEQISVCARVSPEHKLRVVHALQRRGHIVAMTGDGVNDAPALKKANIGIAMGITGTDVSKEAAAMTLTDDNFTSIVAAVEEGRIIFANIKKYLMYLLSSNIGEIGLLAGAALLGLPIPLSTVQILYINLATDGLPALALAVDPPDADVMKQPPHKGSASIFSTRIKRLMLAGGVWSSVLTLGLFMWTQSSGRSLVESMTMTFAALVLIEFFKAYSFRSEHRSILDRPFTNHWLNKAIILELIILALVIYLPVLQTPFRTMALSLQDWLIVGGLAFTIVPVLEIVKRIGCVSPPPRGGGGGGER